MRYYFDASALAKAFAPEHGSDPVLWLLDEKQETITSRLGLVEVVGALERRVRDGDLSREEADAAIYVIRNSPTPVRQLLELSSEVAHRAYDSLHRHRLRASDAVHLASALFSGADVFVCADHRLLAAAADEGLQCFDPTAPPAETPES